MATQNNGALQLFRTFLRWQRRLPEPVRYVWLVVLYLVAWAVLDKVSLGFETAPEVQIWYPPSALDFVLMLVFGLRYTPALWLNTWVHQYIVTHRHLNFVTLQLFDLVTTAGYAGASALLLYKLQINPRLRRLRDVVWFIVVAVLIAPLIVGWLQVMNFASSGLIPWSEWGMYTLHYWAGDATGIAMLAPVLLILLRKVPGIWLHKEQNSPAMEVRPRWPTLSEVPELLAESVALVVGIWLAYGAPRGDNLDYTYLVFLPLIWSALRHGFERAAVTVLFINVGVALLVQAKVSHLLALQFGLMTISQTGLFLGAITTQRLQTEKALRDSARQLSYNAFHDPLTSLPNRALFMDRLQQALEHGKRNLDFLFAVLFIDLDRFKVINDSLGHILGDQLLIAIAARLKACLRPTDTAARLGGDEFIILLEYLSEISDTIRVAERIQAELTLPFLVDGQEVFIGASIGIALSTSDYDRPENLLRDADIAMYRAKSQGSARYEIFNTSMHARAVTRLQMETQLRRAIERQEFLVYYQPLVSLFTGRIIGFEALVRWQHPQRGLLSPARFILLAEETGLGNLIDQWVLREACRQTQQWQQVSAGGQLTISVNLGNKQFTQSNIIQQTRQILQETSLDASCLKLEITENVLMENGEYATATLSQLKALGIRLVIDDFGTGYSSLGRLHRFPIDELKIDRSFVSQIGTGKGNLEITETIVTLAQKLGVDVTAEGIETAEQLALLRNLKCGYGQGYFFSRPLNSEAAEALIVTNPQW